LSIYHQLSQLVKEGKPVAVATIIKVQGSVPRHEGTKMLIFPDGTIEGTIGGGEVENIIIQEAQESLSKGKARLLHYNFSNPERGDPGVCGGEMDVFIEPIRPKETLLIFGMGHVGKAVAHLGSWLGFRIVAADDRVEFVKQANTPDADLRVHCQLAELPNKVEITDQTFVILTTRDVTIDVAGIPGLVHSPASYIGVIGSRRRWETTAKQLKENGVSAADIKRVTSPMGLEIHAETPEEIAVSILSEIIMIQREASGEKMAHVPASVERDEGE
jgi:xanthine dehydrogenase accessory factor